MFECLNVRMGKPIKGVSSDNFKAFWIPQRFLETRGKDGVFLYGRHPTASFQHFLRENAQSRTDLQDLTIPQPRNLATPQPRNLATL